jgi:hypothetical protein
MNAKSETRPSKSAESRLGWFSRQHPTSKGDDYAESQSADNEVADAKVRGNQPAQVVKVLAVVHAASFVNVICAPG